MRAPCCQASCTAVPLDSIFSQFLHCAQHSFVNELGHGLGSQTAVPLPSALFSQTQCPGLLLTAGVLMTTQAVLFLELYAGTNVLGVFPKWKNGQNCMNFTKIKVAAGKQEEKEMTHSLKKRRSFQLNSHTAGLCSLNSSNHLQIGHQPNSGHLV